MGLFLLLERLRLRVIGILMHGKIVISMWKLFISSINFWACIFLNFIFLGKLARMFIICLILAEETISLASSSNLLIYKVKGYFTRCMASSMVGAQPSFSTLAILTNEPVVSVDCLHANIRDPDLKVSDLFSLSNQNTW